MEQVAHWTQGSVANFVYDISSTFVAQLETKMEKDETSRSELAGRLNKSTGRVSQVFNDPGNLSLRVIVEYARELGLKVALVAYDDGDPTNDRGPLNPNVFVKCWEKQGRPSNLFEVNKIETTSFGDRVTAAAPVTYVYWNGVALNAGQNLYVANPTTGRSESVKVGNYQFFPYMETNRGTVPVYSARRRKGDKAA
jgi:hypothetical protein